jgi:hypothetical protein
MSTTLKAPNRLKNSKCKKGQLSNRPPIPNVAETGIGMPKEEPQVLKVKLSYDSHLNVHIYSRGNTKEYLAHIVAVLRIMKQKWLDAKCRRLVKAVIKQSKPLKNLLIAARSRDTAVPSCEACRHGGQSHPRLAVCTVNQPSHSSNADGGYEVYMYLLW